MFLSSRKFSIMVESGLIKFRDVFSSTQPFSLSFRNFPISMFVWQARYGRSSSFISIDDMLVFIDEVSLFYASISSRGRV